MARFLIQTEKSLQAITLPVVSTIRRDESWGERITRQAPIRRRLARDMHSKDYARDLREPWRSKRAATEEVYDAGDGRTESLPKVHDDEL